MYIRDCVESAIDVVAQKALAKGLDIIARVSPSVPFTIRCDTIRLKQILFNLLSNAVKVRCETTHAPSCTDPRRRLLISSLLLSCNCVMHGT